MHHILNDHDWVASCGKRLEGAPATTERDDVTCGRCKRTLRFKQITPDQAARANADRHKQKLTQMRKFWNENH